MSPLGLAAIYQAEPSRAGRRRAGMDGAGVKEERVSQKLGKGRAAAMGHWLSSILGGGEAPDNEPNEQPRRRITTLPLPPGRFLCPGSDAILAGVPPVFRGQ